MTVPFGSLATNPSQSQFQDASDTYSGQRRLNDPGAITAQNIKGSALDKRARNALMLGLLGAGVGYAMGGGGGAAAGAALGGLGGYAKSRFLDEPEAMKQWNAERDLIVNNNAALDQSIQNRSATYKRRADAFEAMGYKEKADQIRAIMNPANFSSLEDYKAAQERIDSMIQSMTPMFQTDRSLQLTGKQQDRARAQLVADNGVKIIQKGTGRFNEPPPKPAQLKNVKTPAGVMKIETPKIAGAAPQAQEAEPQQQPGQIILGGQPGVRYAVDYPVLQPEAPIVTGTDADGRPILGAGASDNVRHISPDTYLAIQELFAVSPEQANAAIQQGNINAEANLARLQKAIQIGSDATSASIPMSDPVYQQNFNFALRNPGSTLNLQDANADQSRASGAAALSNASTQRGQLALQQQEAARTEATIRAAIGKPMYLYDGQGKVINTVVPKTPGEVSQAMASGYKIGGGMPGGTSAQLTTTTSNTGGLPKPGMGGPPADFFMTRYGGSAKQ